MKLKTCGTIGIGLGLTAIALSCGGWFRIFQEGRLELNTPWWSLYFNSETGIGEFLSPDHELGVDLKHSNCVADESELNKQWCLPSWQNR